MKKKVAFFVIDHTLIGGVERVTSSLIALFRKNDIEVNHVFSLFAENEVPQLTFPSTINYKVLGTKNKKEIVSKMVKLLQENNIDTLVFQGDNMTITLAILKACEIAGSKGILHYHGSPYAYLKKYIYSSDIVAKPINRVKILWSKMVYPFKKQKLIKVIRLAKDGIVCVSNGAAEELKTIFNLTKKVKEKIITIHNPLTFEILDFKEVAFEKKEKIVVYVSRLERKHKNSKVVVKAWEHIAINNPDWKLWILGDGRIKKEMEKYVEDNKIQNIVFHGMVSDVQNYLRKSSIAVLSSDCEGFGMGMAESASFANALVATKSDGGIVDIVEEGITGCLVPKNDSNSLGKAIENLMIDTEKRNYFAKNAYEKVKAFSETRIIDLWNKTL